MQSLHMQILRKNPIINLLTRNSTNVKRILCICGWDPGFSYPRVCVHLIHVQGHHIFSLGCFNGVPASVTHVIHNGRCVRRGDLAITIVNTEDDLNMKENKMRTMEFVCLKKRKRIFCHFIDRKSFLLAQWLSNWHLQDRSTRSSFKRNLDIYYPKVYLNISDSQQKLWQTDWQRLIQALPKYILWTVG